MPFATVTKTPTIVTLENASVRMVFYVGANYVPTELTYKRGSKQNLIQGFGLYYQYDDPTGVSSVNEGCPPGNITNGRCRTVKQNGDATVEFRYDTPHFHVTRTTTVPASGPVVKFVYELECIQSGDFAFSLPFWAPLAERMDREARYVELLRSKRREEGAHHRSECEVAHDPHQSVVHGAQCYFDSKTGDGIVVAPVREECVGGITGRLNPRFEPGMKEKVTFVIVPFQGSYERLLTSHLKLEKGRRADRSNASSAVVLMKTSELVVWADHATRKIFPHRPPRLAREAFLRHERPGVGRLR